MTIKSALAWWKTGWGQSQSDLMADTLGKLDLRRARLQAIEDVVTSDTVDAFANLYMEQAKRQAQAVADTRPAWIRNRQDKDVRHRTALHLMPSVLAMIPWHAMTQEEMVAKAYEFADEFYKQSFNKPFQQER